jgi:hypothetical protein
MITNSGIENRKSEYSDIIKPYPYIEYSGTSNTVEYIDMIYVPNEMRSKGIGRKLVTDWLKSLDPTVKRIKLKAATLGGSDANEFWKSLGFVDAYAGENLDHDIHGTLTMGVNGYSNPECEHVIESENDCRHWIEGLEDIAHFDKNPQTLLKA